MGLGLDCVGCTCEGWQTDCGDREIGRHDADGSEDWVQHVGCEAYRDWGRS